MTASIPPTLPEGFDFTDPELFRRRLPHEEWRELRRTEPLCRVIKQPGAGGFADDHYWLATKHADVKEISHRTGVDFTPSTHTAIPRLPENADPAVVEAQGSMLINEDGEVHKQHRRIISRGFTPRAVAPLREALAERARRIVEEAARLDSTDFVPTIAAELPLQAIAELLGVPQEDRHKVFEWSNDLASYDVPGGFDRASAASIELLVYAHAMAEDRRSEPKNDVSTKLIQAGQGEDTGELSSDEFGMFMTLLAFAGNETTRNATTHGMLAMLANPEQWEMFKAERPATAYEEILRWASPVTQFQRTATSDVELGGTTIPAGDRVVMCYASANFDEDIFSEPFRFDITRDPNPHLTFGGQGPHYCIGANLARLQIELIFSAIADVLPDLRSLGEPERLASGWLNGITSWQVSTGR